MVPDVSGYHWQTDHRVLLMKVKSQFKASCHCGEQSPKGTEKEVEAWVARHLAKTP